TEMFSSHLESSFLPDPDLIIRTSGESRLSNFFLWSAAYSELLIVEKMWPDFNLRDLDSAILEFGGRERRFGKTSAQVWPQVSESSETTGEI
ncbi:MAG: undecaprenyl diphosphate synthase family protein, partial [Bdellovibrionales bacterium]|nr:undecaprenyl diphosphate synthase family protein [Bdellovibrionales bacterium]